MRVPVDKVIGAVKQGASVKRESDVPVRVAVYVDQNAPRSIIDAVRGAFVPQTTSGLVRVERIADAPLTVKPDTDVALVITGGSERLEGAVHEIVIGGAPVAVLAESSVDAPFIVEDTPMLGLIAAGEGDHLLSELARWILARTEKGTAFAANFPFMRRACATHAVASSALANMATGALVFIPGADFPVMTLTQLGMALQLSTIYGKPLRPERGYEAAGVVASGVAMRALARAVVSRVPGPAGVVVKALVAGAGTVALGAALTEVYERDVDYSGANAVLARVARAGRDLVSSVAGSAGAAGEQTAERVA